MQKTVANNAIEDLLKDFKPNVTLLNEMIYEDTTVISPVTIINEQNIF